MTNTRPYFGLSTSKYSTPTCHLLDLQLDRHVSAPTHFHERAHFCLVLQGCYTEKIGRKVFERVPMDVMYHPAGVTHSGTNLTGSRCLVIEIANNVVSRAQLECSLFRRPCHFRNADANELAIKLYDEVRQPQVCSGLAVEALILEMLVLVARQFSSAEPRRVPGWLIDLKDRLNLEFLSSPTLATLSADLGRNPSHVARVFRQQTGMSVGEYVRHLKIELAKRHLIESDKPLSVVAKASGFSDAAHFSNVFRKLTGTTPRQYRLSRLLD